jgi:hypothetical protein
MCLYLEIIPQKFLVYIEIQKGMYGLSKAVILAYQLLEKCLATKGFYQCQHTPGLWQHVWQNITFCLVADDFSIKVTNMHIIDHLTNALKERSTVDINMVGSLFCGIQVTWNYIKGHINCHMPGYINKALQNTITPNWSLPNILPTKPLQSNMAQKFRGWRLTTYNHSPQKKSNMLKTLLAPYCTMHVKLIQNFYPQSGLLLHNKPMAHRGSGGCVSPTPCCHSPKCWHMLQSL